MDDRCENNLKSSGRLKQEANKEHTVQVLADCDNTKYLMKKVCELFGIYKYFLYLCNVIYSCSLFEDINSYNNSFKIVILLCNF